MRIIRRTQFWSGWSSRRTLVQAWQHVLQCSTGPNIPSSWSTSGSRGLCWTTSCRSSSDNWTFSLKSLRDNPSTRSASPPSSAFSAPTRRGSSSLSTSSWPGTGRVLAWTRTVRSKRGSARTGPGRRSRARRRRFLLKKVWKLYSMHLNRQERFKTICKKDTIVNILFISRLNKASVDLILSWLIVIME